MRRHLAAVGHACPIVAKGAHRRRGALKAKYAIPQGLVNRHRTGTLRALTMLDPSGRAATFANSKREDREERADRVFPLSPYGGRFPEGQGD